MKKCPTCRGKCYVLTDHRGYVKPQNQMREICSSCRGLGYVPSRERPAREIHARSQR